MSTHKFNHTWIEKLPYSSKRKLYIDSSINTKFTNTDFILLVGARSKTAYLRYRPIENGKRKQVLKKIGDANAIPLADLKESYTKQALQILRNDSPILIPKKTRDVNIGNLIDFYIAKNDVSDTANMLALKNQPYLKKTVGDLICVNQDIFTIKELLQSDVDAGSLYAANMKREFIVRVWNYALENHKEYNKILKTVTNPASFSMVKWCKFKKEASTVVLHKEHYPKFFETVNGVSRSDFRDLFYMFLYTGQHPYSEVCKMRWEQIKKVDNQYWWFMEKGFHKSDEAHQFPLHPMAMDIINKYKGNDDIYVFKNIYDRAELHSRATFKNVLRRLRKTHNITWDIRCLRASFVTTISELNNSYKAGILCNHAGQNITETNYTREDEDGILMRDFKIDMINNYMELIQDKLNEVSK